MRFFLKFIVAPLALVLLVELLFALGAWEPMAKPQSHAGTSVGLKRALESASFKHIDYVSIGSSRGVYGIDHEALVKMAHKHGAVYADATMPGSHWMTIDVLTNWLVRHHPEIEGGILALADQDFLYAGNGAYELGIAYPFHQFSDIPDMAQHVPFERNKVATWGLYSALFAYREDVQDFVRHPKARFKSLAWARARTPESILATNPHKDEDMCRFGLDSLSACDAIEAGTDQRAQDLRGQCVQLRDGAKNQGDLIAMSKGNLLPEFMRKARDLIQSRLRALRWTTPPVVVLMPVPNVWNSVSPRGLHEWALAILQPLVDAGTIRLIDATHALETPDETSDCTAFFDFYHQNDSGRARLMRIVQPQVQSVWFTHDTSPTTAPKSTTLSD